jgi:Tfp pilus assembly protein PilF
MRKIILIFISLIFFAVNGHTQSEEMPLEAKMHLNQALSYINMARKTPSLARENYENAINELTLAIKKYPVYTEAFANRAVVYMQLKKFNKAMDDLKAAEQINPKDPNLHYNYMAWYSLQNQLDRALDSLDEALTNGFSDYDSLRHDPDLKNVRKHPEFRKICEKHKVFLK